MFISILRLQCQDSLTQCIYIAYISGENDIRNLREFTLAACTPDWNTWTNLTNYCSLVHMKGFCSNIAGRNAAFSNHVRRCNR